MSIVCLSEAASISDSSSKRIAEVMSVAIETPCRSRKMKERFWDRRALRGSEGRRSTARENAAARGDRRRESQWQWEEKGLAIEWVVKVWKAEERSECGVKDDRMRTGEWIEGWIRGN